MKKIAKAFLVIVVFVSLFALGGVIADKQQLEQGIVRLHVIANSDSQEDQAQKLRVKDAVVAYLQPEMQHIDTKEQALDYLQPKLPEIQKLANEILMNEGSVYKATVTLEETSFDTRDYDTFSLPAGVYDALRIQIGEAQGKNWWCVVFPSLCLPATGEGVAATAVASGFDDGLTNTLQREEGYEIRFFILDCFGKLENFFAKQ